MAVWSVYLIRTARGKLYCGISTDVDRRFLQHRDSAGKRGAKFFLGDRPVAIVYCESGLDRAAASRREYAIKRLSRVEKEALVENHQARAGILA